MEKLTGIHHVTAITSNAKRNYEFFTYVLGMRLVKKTVNQDDINTYHLFYADDQGNAGTDITFFDFKGIDKTIHGTNEISRTSFRVANDRALDYWVKRFDHYKVEYEPIKEVFGKKMLFFRDYDDQRYALVSDENNRGVSGGKPWINGPVPLEYAIYGLGPIFTVVNNPEVFGKILQEIMLMRKSGEEGKYSLYEMGEGGTGAQVIVETNYVLPQSRQGYG